MSFSVLPVHTSIDAGLAPGYRPFKDRYNLDSLVQDIKQHLGESGGISSDEVDEAYLISLAQKYISDPSDWISYFHNDTSKNYTRNAIENINHKANIVSGGMPLWNEDDLTGAASACVESREGLSYPRPCQCPLHHEGSGRPPA